MRRLLGARAEAPDDWLRHIEMALRATPDEDRNFDLLSGFLKGLSERDAGTVDAFKRRIAESDDLARALPPSARASKSSRPTSGWLSMPCGRVL